MLGDGAWVKAERGWEEACQRQSARMGCRVMCATGLGLLSALTWVTLVEET